MIATILILAAMYFYLLKEIGWLRIRLPVGADKPKIKVDTDTPYWWMPAELKQQHIMLCQNCNSSSRLHSWRTCSKDKERWVAWKMPARTINAFGCTLNLNAGCNIQRAQLLKAIAYEQRRKVATPKTAPFQFDFKEQVRVGSHHEYIRWNHETNEMDYSTKPKKGYSHRVETDYTTMYHDCLVSKEWLQAHEHDLDGYEPTIELVVENGKALSLNGNFKPNMIKAFMAEYKPARQPRLTRSQKQALV